MQVMREMQVQSLCGEDPWSRKWKFTPVVLPGKSQEQRNLTGYNPQGSKEPASEWLGKHRYYKKLDFHTNIHPSHQNQVKILYILVFFLVVALKRLFWPRIIIDQILILKNSQPPLESSFVKPFLTNSSTVKKAKYRKTDAFKLWCLRRLLGIPWIARRSS